MFESRGGETSVIFYDVKKLARKRKGYIALLQETKDNKIETLFCDKEYLDVAVKLVWQVETVKRWILIDEKDPFYPEANEKKAQGMLWDNVANDTEDFIQQSGWISSITGQLFSREEMEEYAQDVLQKLGKLIHKQDIVVEIGVASGITCLAVAPLVSEYYGIDVSSVTIEKTRKMLYKKGISNVKLEQYDASEINQIERKNVDCVIINSVAQYFTGYNYFLDVIKKCISIMREKGIIYIGDLLNYSLLEQFEKELLSVGGKGRNLRDLWYPVKFLKEIPSIFKEVGQVEITSKVGKIDNELKKYRMDAILYIDKTRLYSKQRTCFPYSALWENIQRIAEEYDDKEFLEVLDGKNSNGLFR